MIGNNTLEVNTATMIEAAQLWIDANMKDPAPTVTAVAKSDDHNDTFKFVLSADADRPSKPTPAV